MALRYLPLYIPDLGEISMRVLHLSIRPFAPMKLVTMPSTESGHNTVSMPLAA